MSKNKIKLAALAISVTLATMSVPLANAGGLQSKMDAVFGDMVNVSNPGVFETQRRGVLSGGSVYVRSPMVNTELVNLQIPSVKAGCGGIDIFGGSFSFINADQFVQLLRSVASNAKGYAFNIALDIACSDCMAWINALQAKIQRLNEQFGNSCQLAQGLVTDVANAFGANRENQYSLIGAATGIKNDFFDSKNWPSGKDTQQEVDAKNPEKAKAIVGNLVWDALNKAKANAWVNAIAAASTAKEENELFMSASGTIVVPPVEEDADDPANGSSNNPIHYPQLIDFQSLIEGGKVSVYKCNDDACLKPTKTEMQVTGMVKRVQELLLGDAAGTSVGVIAKFGMTDNNSFTTKEANMMGNLPSSLGALVRNLSTASNETARQNANDIAYAIAMSWAHHLISDQLKAIRQTMMTSNKPEAKDVIAKITDCEQKLTNDYAAYEKEHPSVSKLMGLYNDIQQNIYKISVVAASSPETASLGDK